MWKILHRIFGWHYIVMQYGMCAEVFRVQKAPNGLIYIKAYGEIIYQESWKLWEPLTFEKEQDNG